MQQTSVALWKQAPLVRCALPLFAGIILQSECRFSIGELLAVLFILIAFYAGICFLPPVIHFEKPYLRGTALVFFCMWSGACLYHLNDIRSRPDWIGYGDGSQRIIIFSLKEPAVERAKSFKAEAVLESVFKNGHWQRATGNILVYFSKETDKRSLRYGARLAAYSLLQPIRNTGNPGSFDFAGYAAKKNIYHSIFVSPDNSFRLDPPHPGSFMAFIHASRASIVSIFKKHLSDRSGAAGLAEALVIGYKNDLDKEVVADYTNTGVVHVIAISGMHLALVYFVLEWIWKIVGLYRRKILSGILSIIILWVFSFLTGGTPSVLRSAIMFSFVISGRMINREGSVFNSLTASAFFLAVYDPFVLWDPGFLLSHLAVLGLITLQAPFASFFQVKNKWISKVADMLILTTAAQIFTLPLCLYYFHQFPNYFLLSNLLIIPLSTVILFGGILLILASPCTGLAHVIGFILSKLIVLMNAVAREIGHWPGALIENIYFGQAGLVILYVFIILLSLWLIRQKFIFLKIGLISLCLFFLFDAFGRLRYSRQRLFIVYNVRGHSACDIILGDRYYFWGDSLLTHNHHMQDSILSSGRNFLHVRRRMAAYDMKNHSSIRAGKMRMALPSDISPEFADFIVINRDHEPPATTSGPGQCRKLVFDGSCKLWKIEKMRRVADSLHLPCHPVALEGAFSVNIPVSNSSL